MGLPNETSLVCEGCGEFNFQDGFIIDGEIYCESCGEAEKKRKLEGA